jgi:hypothetical protein
LNLNPCGSTETETIVAKNRRRSRRDDGDDDDFDDDDDDDFDDDRPRRRSRETSGKAVASLILGISGFCLPVLPALIGLVLGSMAISECNRKRYSGQGLAIAGLILSAISLVANLCIMPALLIPAVQKVREAAARTQMMNNAKQMALTFHAHNDQHKSLPSPDGWPTIQKPGQLSWRVSILPYVEQDLMFKQFDLNQPWDSPNNQPFLSRMPSLYDNVRDMKPTDGNTAWQVFVGPDTVFPNRNAKVSFSRITDGTSNTMLFAESATAVPWTKPADMQIPDKWNADAPQPLPLPQKFLAAMADGTVRIIDRSNVSDKTLRMMICPNDGNPLPFDAP